MTQTRLRVLLVVVLFIVASVVFATLFRDAIREVVVEPMIGLIIQARMVWRSLRSDVVWGFFWLVCILLAILIFPSVQQQLERSLARPADSFRSRVTIQSPTVPASSQISRLAFWTVEVKQMYEHRFLARFTVMELKKLVLEEIAFREKYETRHQAERWLLENPDRVPVAVQQLFNGEIHSPTVTTPRRVGWLYRLLLSWGWIVPDVSPVTIDRNLDAILAYLERKPEAMR